MKPRKLVNGLCLLVLAASHAAGQAPCAYDVAAIIQAPICPLTGDHPPTIGTAISPNGQYVVGYYYGCGGGAIRPFWWSAEAGFQVLALPPGEGSANDVTDEGLMVGGYGTYAGQYFGFIYDIPNGQFIAQLPPLDPDGLCDLNAINARVNAVGGDQSTTEATPSTLTQPSSMTSKQKHSLS